MQLRGVKSSSDDDKIDEPRSKKADRLDKLISTINSTKSSIKDINMYTRNTKGKLPIGLKCALQENFKCKICHSLPMQPPVVLAKVPYGVNHVLTVGIVVQMPWQKLAYFTALNLGSEKQ